jgi:hypothetical protein
MSTQPVRRVEIEIIAVRPTERAALDCLLDGAPCVCIAVGENAPLRGTLQPGQRVMVHGRPSDVVNHVFEVERITPVE